MDLSNPLAAVTPTLDAGVLHVLAGTTVACTAADVHRRLRRGSDQGVRKVLARLVGQGVVIAEPHPRSPRYLLNRDHVATPHIIGLATARETIIGRIVTQIDGWSSPALHASLFGSFARGEADADSDIDVLVVRDDSTATGAEPTWSAQLDSLVNQIRTWTGNDGQVVDVGLEELRAMREAQDPLLDSWRSEAVLLVGERLTALLRGT